MAINFTGYNCPTTYAGVVGVLSRDHMTPVLASTEDLGFSRTLVVDHPTPGGTIHRYEGTTIDIREPHSAETIRDSREIVAQELVPTGRELVPGRVKVIDDIVFAVFDTQGDFRDHLYAAGLGDRQRGRVTIDGKPHQMVATSTITYLCPSPLTRTRRLAIPRAYSRKRNT